MEYGPEYVRQVLADARREVAKVIVGQENALNQALIAIFTGNHLLIEGVPGVGKTLLVRTLAHVLGCEFSRIQFTPDLMPADITGTNVFSLQKSEFALVKGPIFTTFLLADEINRAPAKTQSALLQAMQERSVTIDRQTHELSPNFTVFATQNPIEFEGTYPLPEAEKDRFMMKVDMPYPGRDNELDLARRMLDSKAPEQVLARGEVKQVVTAETLLRLRSSLEAFTVKDDLLAYIVDVVRATRTHEAALVGAGPRATQALLLASRAKAAMEDRDFVTPDDVKSLAESVLGHRIILRPEYEIEGLTIGETIQEILRGVTVPR